MLSKFINPAYAPRFANIALAIWLFVSAFVWAHDANPTMLKCFAAALVGTFEIMAMMHSKVRFANTFMGILIIGEGLVVHQYLPFTRWHDAAIGLVILLISFVPSPDMPGADTPMGNDAQQHH